MQIPVFIALLCSPAVAGGILTIASGRRRLGGESRPRHPRQILRTLTKPVTVVIVLTILTSGMIGSLWGYATQTDISVQVSCKTMSLNPAIAQNGTVGVRNPSYLPLDGFWKITYTYNYSGSQFVFSDTESFHIPPEGTTYVSFGFAGSGQHPFTDTLITTVYDRHYRVLLWSFDQTTSLYFGLFGKLPGTPENFGPPDITGGILGYRLESPLCFPLGSAPPV